MFTVEWKSAFEPTLANYKAQTRHITGRGDIRLVFVFFGEFSRKRPTLHGLSRKRVCALSIGELMFWRSRRERNLRTVACGISH